MKRFLGGVILFCRGQGRQNSRGGGAMPPLPQLSHLWAGAYKSLFDFLAQMIHLQPSMCFEFMWYDMIREKTGLTGAQSVKFKRGGRDFNCIQDLKNWSSWVHFQTTFCKKGGWARDCHPPCDRLCRYTYIPIVYVHYVLNVHCHFRPFWWIFFVVGRKLFNWYLFPHKFILPLCPD